MKAFQKLCALAMAMLLALAMPLSALADDSVPSEIAAENSEVPQETVVEEPLIVEEPVVDEPVVDEPVVDEPVVDEPVVDEPVVDEPVVDEPAVDEPAVDEPAVDEPAVDEPAVDEPVVDEPVVDEPVVDEPVVDEVEEPEASVDFTQSVAMNPAFTDGYAQTTADVKVYESVNGDSHLGLLHEDAVVKVLERPELGANKERVRISFITANGKLVGYVVAERLRPMTQEEIDALPDDAVCAFDAIPAEEPIENETKEPLEDVDEKTEEPAEDVTDEKTEEPTEDVTGEESEKPAEETAEEVLTLSAAEVIPAPEAELVLPDYSYPGAVILTNGVTTSGVLPAIAGSASNAYFTLNVPTACFVNFEFKGINSAGGNMDITITSDDNYGIVVWSGSIPKDGNRNFNDCLEAGSYDVVVSKSDTADAAAYGFQLTPSFSLVGEHGTLNNSTTTSAAISVDGSYYTGIISVQDVDLSRSDYYRLVLASPGKLSVGLENRISESMTMDILDGATDMFLPHASTSVPSGSESSTAMRTNSFWMDAGTYYLVVPAGTSTGRYRVTSSFVPATITEVEPNNSISQASNRNVLAVNGTTVTGLISEGGTLDYYHIHLTTRTKLNLSVKAQFAGVNLRVVDIGGKEIANSAFGGTNTNGKEGVPHEYELKDLVLDAGHYYLEVSKLSSYTGIYTVRAYSTLVTSDLLVERLGAAGVGNLHMKASTSGGYALISSWFEVSLNNKTLYKTTPTICNEANYFVPQSGVYTVKYTCFDGTTWDSLQKTIYIEVSVLKVASVVATPDNTTGKISCVASLTTPKPLLSSTFELLKDNVGVETIRTTNGTTATFTAPIAGNYTIHYTAYDGVTWADGWASCNVTHVPTAVLPLSVSSLSATVDSVGNVHIQSAVVNGYPLTSAHYRLILGGQEVGRQVTTASNCTIPATQAGTYSIQYVAFDGHTWADAWIGVTVTSVQAKVLTVTSITATPNDSGLIKCAATTQYGSALLAQSYSLYLNGVKLSTVTAVNKQANLQVSNDGVYDVQFTAYDGRTWADNWTKVTVKLSEANKPLQITSLTATPKTNGGIDCVITTQHGRGLVLTNYNLFSASGIIQTWSGNTLSHTIYAPASGQYSVQVVAFDGVTWVESWQAVTVTIQQVTHNLTVTAIDFTADAYGNIACRATTQYGSPLLSGTFSLWSGSSIIKRINGITKAGTFIGVAPGSYSVQYSAYDGTTWAEKFVTLSVSSNGLTVSNVSAVTNPDGTITAQGAVTGGYPIMVAKFELYANNVCMATWDWPGIGSYTSHVFNMAGQAVDTFHYVVFDGVNWVDGWATVY